VAQSAEQVVEPERDMRGTPRLRRGERRRNNPRMPGVEEWTPEVEPAWAFHFFGENMLAKRLEKGVVLEGLRPLLINAAPVANTYCTFGENVITFATESSEGATPVQLLPYQGGKNATVTMQGQETISGEFTGCIFGIYREEGVVKATHVDTAASNEDETPVDQWNTLKASEGVEVLNEYSTAGIVSNYVFGKKDSLKTKVLTAVGKPPAKLDWPNVTSICIASPNEGHAVTCAIVVREGQVYKVRKVIR
jgi:hypothetical protein